MTSEAHSMNDTNPDNGSVLYELKPIKIEDTSEYCHYLGGNHDESLNDFLIEPIKKSTAFSDAVRTSGEPRSELILLNSDIKLENVDFEEAVADEKLQDTCMEEKKPNVIFKSDSEECDVNNFNFHGIQILPITDRDEIDCGENKPLHWVKEEEITVEENYLEKKEPVKRKL